MEQAESACAAWSFVAFVLSWFASCAGRRCCRRPGCQPAVWRPPAQQQAGQLTLENSSFMYRKLPPEAEQRELQINDIITVLVTIARA